MEVSSQLCALAALPPGKSAPVLIGQENPEPVWTRSQPLTQRVVEVHFPGKASASMKLTTHPPNLGIKEDGERL
jgi:hypothetical protein